MPAETANECIGLQETQPKTSVLREAETCGARVRARIGLAGADEVVKLRQACSDECRK